MFLNIVDAQELVVFKFTKVKVKVASVILLNRVVKAGLALLLLIPASYISVVSRVSVVYCMIIIIPPSTFLMHSKARDTKSRA